jgi:AraC family transcriptional activator of pobA
VLHGFAYHPDVRGRILTISRNWLEAFFEKRPQVALTMGSFWQMRFSPSQEALFARLQHLAYEIDRELFAAHPEKKAFLQALIQQLCILIYRLRQPAPLLPPAQGPLMLEHFRRFQHYIQEADPIPPIPQIAKALGMSTVHLNRICRQAVGKPAKALIQEALILQARNYLRHTSYSISEIAYRLHFEYPNYFARLFRKHTGLSPGNYRARGEWG